MIAAQLILVIYADLEVYHKIDSLHLCFLGEVYAVLKYTFSYSINLIVRTRLERL